ncbi:hypothetical protein BHE74_00037222 [Ensete ventricosum]|nr:hypothetical protein BHE74_00037222 [Ensete ventricosum]
MWRVGEELEIALAPMATPRMPNPNAKCSAISSSASQVPTFPPIDSLTLSCSCGFDPPILDFCLIRSSLSTQILCWNLWCRPLRRGKRSPVRLLVGRRSLRSSRKREFSFELDLIVGREEDSCHG